MSLVNCEYTLTQTRPYSCRPRMDRRLSDQTSDKQLQALATIKLGTFGDPYLGSLRLFPPNEPKLDAHGRSHGEGSADLELRFLREYHEIDHSRLYNSEWLRAFASMLNSIADQMDLLPTTDQVESTMVINKLDNQ